MIYCLKNKPETYNEGDFGLYASYGHNRRLFNILSRTCLAFFTYEEETIAKPKLAVLEDIDFYKELKVDDIENKFPFEIELSLPPPHDFIAQLRLLQWKKHYRGKLRGNKVQFRSGLTKAEDELLTDIISSF